MEGLFDYFIENLSIPIWVKNMDLEFIYCNREYCNSINMKLEDLLGKKNEELFDKNLVEFFNNHCFEVLDKKKSVTKDAYIGKGYTQCTVMPIKNEFNDILGIVGVIGVLTENGRLKEKDYELENNRNLITKIIDTLPGTVFYKNRESEYIYANEECKEFYKERGIFNILGKTDSEINKDKELADKFIKDDKFIIENKKSIKNEAIFKDDKGNKRYREVIKMPLFDSYGNVLGIIGRSMDITERKLYQQKLEYLSYTDSLTGAKNRLAFEEREKEMSDNNNLIGVIMGDANGLKLVNDTFGHREGDNLLIQIVNILKKVSKTEVYRIGGDEFAILLENATIAKCEELILKIQEKCNEYEDDLFNVSISLGCALKKDVDEDIYNVLKEAEDKVYRQKLLQNNSIKGSILSSLKIGFGVSSEETEQHTERVAITAERVGRRIGLEMAKLDELKIAAELHDIGKIGIPEKILLKKGRLTDEEYEIMKTHAEKSYRIIKASSELREIAEATLYHHERWDGCGYPKGLKGEEIPLLARIISVCDSYDVMISKRSYKEAMSKDEARKELIRCSGSQFDPKIVEIFLSLGI